MKQPVVEQEQTRLEVVACDEHEDGRHVLGANLRNPHAEVRDGHGTHFGGRHLSAALV